MRDLKTRCRYRTWKEAYAVFEYIHEIEKKLEGDRIHNKDI